MLRHLGLTCYRNDEKIYCTLKIHETFDLSLESVTHRVLRWANVKNAILKLGTWSK